MKWTVTTLRCVGAEILLMAKANRALECCSFKFGHVENAVSGSLQYAFG